MEGYYILCKIDGEEVRLDAFVQADEPTHIITTNATTTEGWHAMTDIHLYTPGDVLVGRVDRSMDFNVVASRTTQIDVELLFESGGAASLTIEAMTFGYVYLKSQSLEVPEGEQMVVGFTGVLGIPTSDIPIYQADSIYNKFPIKNYTKAVFSIRHQHNADEAEWFMYDWAAADPLVITYNKSGNPTDIDTFKIQMYRVLDGKMAEVIGDDWMITLQGDENFIIGDKGLVEFTYLPEGWIGTGDYKFIY